MGTNMQEYDIYLIITKINANLINKTNNVEYNITIQIFKKDYNEIDIYKSIKSSLIYDSYILKNPNKNLFIYKLDLINLLNIFSFDDIETYIDNSICNYDFINLIETQFSNITVDEKDNIFNKEFFSLNELQKIQIHIKNNIKEIQKNITCVIPVELNNIMNSVSSFI